MDRVGGFQNGQQPDARRAFAQPADVGRSVKGRTARARDGGQRGFYLGKYAITQAQWPVVIAESGPFFRTIPVAFSRNYMWVNDEEARTYAELKYALAEE